MKKKLLISCILSFCSLNLLPTIKIINNSNKPILAEELYGFPPEVLQQKLIAPGEKTKMKNGAIVLKELSPKLFNIFVQKLGEKPFASLLQPASLKKVMTDTELQNALQEYNKKDRWGNRISEEWQEVSPAKNLKDKDITYFSNTKIVIK